MLALSTHTMLDGLMRRMVRPAMVGGRGAQAEARPLMLRPLRRLLVARVRLGLADGSPP